MANPSEQPWTNAEKLYMLAEVIKASGPRAEAVFGLVNSMGLQMPSWDDIPLPPGRTLNQTKTTFDQMMPQPTLSTPRLTLATQTSSPRSAPIPLQGKRPFPFESTLSGGQTSREIRPKPAPGGGGYGRLSYPPENPPKKKRGRPTKAEAQARDSVRTAGGASTMVAYPTIGPLGSVAIPTQPAHPAAGPHLPFTQPPAGSTSLAEPPRPAPGPSLPFTSGMSISSMLTPVPQITANASQLGPSIGRQRRARSTDSELGDLSTAEPEQAVGRAVGDERRVEDHRSQDERLTSLDIQSPSAREANVRREGDMEPGTTRSGSYQYAHASASTLTNPATQPDPGAR